MDILNGIFLVIAGLGVMAFGLLIFYAILPLFRRFRTRLSFPSGAPVILTSLGGLHLLSALVFLVPN